MTLQLLCIVPIVQSYPKVLYYDQSNCKLKVYHMSTKSKFNVIYCNHMFHSHFILESTLPTHIPSPLKLQNFTTQNEPK